MDERHESSATTQLEAGDYGPTARDCTSDQRVALDLWTAMASCESLLTKAVASDARGSGLTGPQFKTLEVLYRSGPVRLTVIAEELRVTAGNVTYVIDRLVEEGLVARRKVPGDRRLVLAELTEPGRRRVDEIMPRHVAHLARLAGVLDPEERQEVIRLLTRLDEATTGDGAY